MWIRVKRVYDVPSKTDGTRVLADRLWPRGITKVAARVDRWVKDLAPSHTLRQWYHKDPEGRLKEFRKRYWKELSSQKVHARKNLGRFKRLTVVTAVKDIPRSHVPILVRFLERL